MKSFNSSALLKYLSIALAFSALAVTGTVRGDDAVEGDDVAVDDGYMEDGTDGAGEEVVLEMGGEEGTDSGEVVADEDMIFYTMGGVEGEEGSGEPIENLEDTMTPDPEWVQRGDEVLEMSGDADMEVLMSTSGMAGSSLGEGAGDSATLDLNSQDSLSGIDAGTGADSTAARIEGGRLVVGGRRAAR